jgi:hypothetical protein
MVGMRMMMFSSFESQVVSAITLLVTIHLDLHRGYWSEPAGRAMKIPEGLLLTILRVVQLLAALAFFYLLVDNLLSNNPWLVRSLPVEASDSISLVASVPSALAITWAMFKMGRAHDHVVVTRLHEASGELVKVLEAKFDGYAASLAASQSHFLNTQEKIVKGLASDVSSLIREVRVLQDRIAEYSETKTQVNNNLVDIVQKLE